MPLSASVSTLEDLCSRHILSMLLFLSREDETKEWEPPEDGTEPNSGGEDAEDAEDAEDVEKKRKEPPLDQRDLSAKALARMAFVHGFLSSGALEVLFEHCFNIYQLPILTSQPSSPSSIGPLGKKVCEHQCNDNSAPWTDDDNDTSTNSGSNNNINEGQSFVQPDIGNEDHRVLSGNGANEDNRLPGEAPWAFNTIGRPPDRRSFVLESNIRCVDLDITWTLLNVFLVPHQHGQPQGDHLGHPPNAMANRGSGLHPKSLEFRNDIHSFEYQYRVDQIHRVLILVLDSSASLSLSRIRMPKLVPKPNDANIPDPVILIHVRQLVSQAADQLRHLSLPDNRYCDNETLRLIGNQCHQLQFLDVSGCSQVNDVGVQNLVFPNSVLRAGQVNLANNRIKTNHLSKYLRTLIVWDTGVSETGCVILLRFLPRLLKPAGLLKHPEMANALVRVHDRIGFERGLQVDELYDAGGQVGNASKARVFPHFISRTSRIHTGITTGHGIIGDTFEQPCLSPSMVCLQKMTQAPRSRLSHFYLDIGSSHGEGKEDALEASQTRLLRLMPFLDQIGNGLVVLHLPHQHEILPWEALCHACPHLIELEAGLDVVWDPQQWPSKPTLSHLRVGKLTFDSPWGLAWTFEQLGTQLWECDLTFRQSHDHHHIDAHCWGQVEHVLFASRNWNSLTMKSIKLGSQCHFGVAHLELLMTSMPHLAFMGPLEHWNASIDVEDAEDILERALNRNWNLSLLLRNCIFSTQSHYQSNSLIENPWLRGEQSILSSPQHERKPDEPTFEWGWKIEGTLELFQVEPKRRFSFSSMNANDIVEPMMASGNSLQPPTRLLEGNNPISNSNYPDKINPLDGVPTRTESSNSRVLEQDDHRFMTPSSDESGVSSWDPMDECGLSTHSSSLGEEPEPKGVVEPVQVSSVLAIDDIGSSIKTSPSHWLPVVVPRNDDSNCDNSTDRERANPIKMIKKIGSECPSDSSESSSSEEEEEEEDFQHFLIRTDPQMPKVIESAQLPGSDPWETSANENDEDEDDGDGSEDKATDDDNEDDDEESDVGGESDVEYDLEWYWDYQDKTWKRCDPSEWDLEEPETSSKPSPPQTKPIDKKAQGHAGATRIYEGQDSSFWQNDLLELGPTQDEGIQTAFPKWPSVESPSHTSINLDESAVKLMPEQRLDSSPKLSQTMARLQDRMNFSSDLSRCRTVKNIRQYELERLGQTQLVQKGRWIKRDNSSPEEP